MTKQEAIAAILDTRATPCLQVRLTETRSALLQSVNLADRLGLVAMINECPGDGPFYVKYGRDNADGVMLTVIGSGDVI
jgi:hypothetical protein